MRSFVCTILKRSGGNTHGEVPYKNPMSPFAAPDVQAIKSHLKLEEKGRSRGAHNNPPSNIDHFDQIEQEIVGLIEQRKEKAISDYEEHKDTYEERRNNLRPDGKSTSQIKSALDKARPEFADIRNHDLDELVQRLQDVQDKEKDVDTFKSEHDLDRASYHPESRLIHWGVIGIILLIESMLNGSFLARGNELGLLGGIFEAIVIALINVVFGLFVGWKVVTQCNHWKRYRRICGALGVFIYIVLVIAFNLAVAHYRTALGGDVPENAARLAFETLTMTPFLVEDIRSWLLFLLGCVFSVFAAIDGWRMDDPYPGYGKVVRLRERAREDFSEQKEELYEKLQEVRDEVFKKMETAWEQLRQEKAEYQNITTSRDKLEKLFHKSLDDLENAANQLLESYQDANIKARNTEPPAHFSEKWKLDRLGYKDCHQSDNPDVIQLFDLQITETDSLFEKSRKELITLYSQADAECKVQLTPGMS